MKRFSAAVYGGSGYLGSEAVRRLLAHPEVELRHVYAADHVGQRLGAALPNLEGKTSLRFEAVPLLSIVMVVWPVSPGLSTRTSSSSKPPMRSIRVSGTVVVTEGVVGVELSNPPPVAKASMGLVGLCPVKREIQP